MDINMVGICKSFGTNKVLGGVNLHIRPGEVHALMGENGAGKSTLMNILTGIHKADAGTILRMQKSMALLLFIRNSIYGRTCQCLKISSRQTSPEPVWD